MVIFDGGAIYIKAIYLYNWVIFNVFDPLDHRLVVSII